jgi:hypothetical protein
MKRRKSDLRFFAPYSTFRVPRSNVFRTPRSEFRAWMYQPNPPPTRPPIEPKPPRETPDIAGERAAPPLTEPDPP